MPVRNLTVYIAGDPTNLRTALREAAADVDRFIDSTNRKSATGGGLFQGLGSSADAAKGLILGAGVAIVGALGEAVKSAAEFDTAMRNVNSIAGESEAQFRKTSQAVLDMAKASPQSATTLAKALYEINSSGFQAAQGLQVLDAAQKAATAGLSDADTAAQAISGALNAYGLSAASAKDVSDILFQTVNLGVISFDQLSRNLGDFVGTAAAAGVPLQDAAAALATMTKNGVTANEASTSLNQVFTQLLRPGKDLSGLLHQLGYESGEQALKTDGLYGVMQKLGKATGGSASQLVTLFQSVEAGRGAFALLAGDGKAYADIQAQIGDKSKVAGATQKAFNEQMKAASNQFKIFVNQAQVTGIEIGSRLLPALVQLLQGMQQIGSDALPYIQQGFQAVAPLFGQLGDIIGTVASVLGTLVAAAAPVAGALAAIAGAALITSLHGLLSVLQGVTHFLADHRGIVEAVAAIYAARLLPSLAAVGVAFNRMILTPIVLFLNQTLIAAEGAGAAAKGLAASLLSVQAVATAGMAVAIFGLVRGLGQLHDAEEAGKKQADDLTKGFNAYDTTKSQKQLGDLRAVMEHGAEVGQQYTGFFGTLKAGFSEFAGDGSVGKVAEEGATAADKYLALNAVFKNTNDNLKQLSQATGLAPEVIGRIAQAQNIDLSKPIAESADARQQIIDYLKDVRSEDGKTTQAIAHNSQLSIQQFEDLAKAAKKVVDAATSAFAKDTDVLGQFDPAGDAKKVADAQARLDKARRSETDSLKKASGDGSQGLRDDQRTARDRQRVRDAEERALTNHSKSQRSHLADAQSINRAKQKLADDEALIGAKGKGGGAGAGSQNGVADAEASLAEAKAAQAKGSLQNRYKEALRLSKQFVTDINTAIQRGLDPEVVSKLLQEGPTKAEPALQAILKDHTGRMIRMVNDSESAISQFSGFVAEQARIAALATNAPTDQYTKDVKTAMAIAAREAAAGGKATTEQLAESLHVPPDEVARIAQEFGITLAGNVQDAVNKFGPIQLAGGATITYTELHADDAIESARAHRGQTSAQRRKKPVPPPRRRNKFDSLAFATGGMVTGPPGGDVIPAMLTANEYVLPVAAVKHYGVDLMEALRTRTVPRAHFADGGLVGRDGGWSSRVMDVGGPRVVAVPVPISTTSTIDNSQTITVDRVVSDPGGMQRWGGQQRRYSPTRGVT